MRTALYLSLPIILLAACTAQTSQTDINGYWINQAAIDASSKGGSLLDALQGHGPVLDWQIDSSAQLASYDNGFETVEGRLTQDAPALWAVNFHGNTVVKLRSDGKQLLQVGSDYMSQQTFKRVEHASEYMTTSAGFVYALNRSYLGGTWKILHGPGTGDNVQFQPDGTVQGLPKIGHYALCLGGDCAAMSGDRDSIWLHSDGEHRLWLFTRQGKQLEIFQPKNTAGQGEMPALGQGARQWLLQKQ